MWLDGMGDRGWEMGKQRAKAGLKEDYYLVVHNPGRRTGDL